MDTLETYEIQKSVKNWMTGEWIFPKKGDYNYSVCVISGTYGYHDTALEYGKLIDEDTIDFDNPRLIRIKKLEDENWQVFNVYFKRVINIQAVRIRQEEGDTPSVS